MDLQISSATTMASTTNIEDSSAASVAVEFTDPDSAFSTAPSAIGGAVRVDSVGSVTVTSGRSVFFGMAAGRGGTAAPSGFVDAVVAALIWFTVSVVDLGLSPKSSTFGRRSRIVDSTSVTALAMLTTLVDDANTFDEDMFDVELVGVTVVCALELLLSKEVLVLIAVSGVPVRAVVAKVDVAEVAGTVIT